MELTPDPSGNQSSHESLEGSILPSAGLEWFVPELSSTELDQLLGSLTPLVRDPVGNLRVPREHHPVMESFLVLDEMEDAIDGLIEVARITTYHTISERNPSFMPTVAEVLSQIPVHLFSAGISAFETIEPPPADPIEITSPNGTVHRGITILYKPSEFGVTRRKVDDVAIAEQVRALKLEEIKDFVAPRAIDLDPRFASTEMVVVADAASQLEWWHQLHQLREVPWDGDNEGLVATIGYRDVFPVTCEMSWVSIGSRRVLFVDCVSRIHDKALIDNWLSENCSPMTKEGTRAIAEISDFSSSYFGDTIAAINKARTVKVTPAQPEIPSEIMDLINDTFYVVAASPFCRAGLKQEYGENGEFIWEELSPRLDITVGRIGDVDVSIELCWARLDGHLIAFWSPTSDLVDYDLIAEWFSVNLAPLTHDSRIAHTDVTNFDHCLNELSILEPPPSVDEDQGEEQ